MTVKLYIKNNKYTKIALLALVTYILLIFIHKGIGNNDFKCYYVAMQFLKENSLTELYNIDSFLKFNQNYFPTMQYYWFYPPHYVFQLYIFGLLPFWLANFLFVMIGIAVLTGAIYIFSQRVDLTQNIMFYMSATPFIGLALLTSQNSLYTASFLLIGLHFLDKRPIISGLCFALMSYKPQFVIFIPFALLLTQHYKAFFYMGIFFIIQLIASIFIFGFEAWLEFFTATQMIWSLLIQEHLPVNIMASSFATFANLGFSENLAKLLSLFWFVIIGSITLYVWVQRKGDSLAKAILVAGICTASPYLFHYDTALFIVAILFFMQYKNFITSRGEIQIFSKFIILFILLLVISISLSINLIVISQLLLLYYFIKFSKTKYCVDNANIY